MALCALRGASQLPPLWLLYMFSGCIFDCGYAAITNVLFVLAHIARLSGWLVGVSCSSPKSSL